MIDNLLEKNMIKRTSIDYNFLSSKECSALLGSIDDYYENIGQYCLDYLMQKKNASIKEYIEYSKKQARDFTNEEKTFLGTTIEILSNSIANKGLHFPCDVSISFATTTMDEATGAAGYTHGTTIFINKTILETVMNNPDEYSEWLCVFIAHELFHCLTRNNPEFRKGMYSLINFSIKESDFTIPKKVRDIMISNPDVGHHDSFSTFTINGERKNCYLVFLTDGTFEKPGDNFFDFMYTGLVCIDNGELYKASEVCDFYDVMGENTEYCEDPEECLADNFSYAVIYGEDGVNGEGYKTPELIDKIICYLQSI